MYTWFIVFFIARNVGVAKNYLAAVETLEIPQNLTTLSKTALLFIEESR